MLDARSLVERVENTRTVSIIEEPRFGIKPDTNEFLIFLKPEMFSSSDSAVNAKRVDIVLKALEQYKVEVDGIIAVNGSFIEQKEIMAAHYGLINRLSRGASDTVTSKDRETMTKLLGEDCSTIEVLGGHEAMKAFPDLTPKALDTFWFTKQSIKVQSGFYFNKYERGGRVFLLINGFHPFQLSYFTNPDHHVLLLVCHSKTDWKILRWDMIGNTYPEKAASTSIRGTICHQAEGLCFVRVDIAYNGVHFSVGPFEGVIELNNFVGKVLGREIGMETSFAKHLLKQGVKEKDIRDSFSNPTINVDGKEKDLFGATEDMNPEEALKVYIQGK